MFNSLLYRSRSLLATLRRNLRFYWFNWDAGDLIFFTLLGLPVVTLGFLFRFAYTDHVRIELEQQRQADLTCLARNIYFEARGEPMGGQYAVAEVTMNRVASTRFPDTVCDVVHEKRWDPIRKRYVGAFSWTELDAVSRPKGITWQRAVAAAQTIYDNEQAPLVQGALFYHADNIQPRWAKTKKQVAKIGRHIFYE